MRTKAVVRSIFGAVRTDIRPLVYAVEVSIDLMFVQGIPMDDIYVIGDIYARVAERMAEASGAPPSVKTVSRRIERLANQCWDILVERDLVLRYVGAPIRDIRAPSDVIFYLAFFVHLDQPFFVAIEAQPALLF